MSASQQQFCLKWNNFHSNMLECWNVMLANGDFTDVTLACEGTNLKAHKMVLAACSPYFQTLFMANPCKHPIVILKDVRFIDLKAIIDFMYRGEVNVSQDQLSSLLKTAETLKVKGLAEVTEKQARGQSGQLQHALFGSGKKKRKRSKKSGAKDSADSSECECMDDSNIPAKQRHTDSRAASQRLGSQRLLGTRDSVVSEQIEPSRILEQSMATAEVGGENGQDSGLVGFDRTDVQPLDEDAMGHALFDEGATLGQPSEAMMLPGPSTSGQQATIIVLGQGSNATSPNGNSNRVTPKSSPGGSTGSTPPHAVSGEKFVCSICMLKFASNYNLKRHARTHDATRPRWRCSYCDKSFTRRDSLPKHMNFVHKDQAAIKDNGSSVVISGEPIPTSSADGSSNGGPA